jgi:hypothetical protein
MPATQRQQEFQALCHEHHVRMKFSDVRLGPVEIAAYACAEPNCRVHYNTSRGYFMPNLSGTASDIDMSMLPKVRCSRDGVPMYLAETNRQKKGFRLWVCPQCDARHTNEDDLVGTES